MSQIFPRSANAIARFTLIGLLLVGGLTVWIVVTLMRSDYVTGASTVVDQPVQFSHAHHAGGIGIDCRYCHTSVEVAASASIPPTQTCMNCHTNVRTESPKLAPVRESWNTGKPLEWVKVHDLPDYSYFNHSAHVNKGVSCVSCHGRIDHMGEEGVYQAKNLSMGWCLDCHRNPEQALRPKDQVTNLGWTPDQLKLAEPGTESFEILQEMKLEPNEAVTQEKLGSFLKQKYQIRDHQFMTSCSTCHR